MRKFLIRWWYTGNWQQERTLEAICRSNAGGCSWCAGTGRTIALCPAGHHNHNITVMCGNCKGTGVAPIVYMDELNSR
jgi:hypothetical protein